MVSTYLQTLTEINMHIFHKWSKWEQYTWKGTVTMTGLMVSPRIEGKLIPLEESRQRRTCGICGKLQDEEV